MFITYFLVQLIGKDRNIFTVEISFKRLSDSFVPFFCMFNFDCASVCCYAATAAFTDNLGIYGFALYFEGMKGIIIFLTRMGR